MGDALRKKEKLLRLYSHSYAIAFNDNTCICKCPICHRQFTKSDIHGNNSVLSIAHIFPKAIGGNMTTIECKQCNNRLGGLIDEEIVQQKKESEKFSGFMSGTSSMVARGLGDDKDLAIQLDMSPDQSRCNLSIIEAQSNPAKVAEMRNRGHMEFGFGRRNSSRMKLAYYHSAYLFMFHMFGYEYLKIKSVESIRNVIHSAITGNDILSRQIVLQLNIVHDLDMGIQNYVHIFSSKESSHFVVVFPSIASPRAKSTYGIVMPGFSDDYTNSFSSPHVLAEAINSKSYKLITVREFVPQEKRLTTAEFGKQLWRRYHKDL